MTTIKTSIIKNARLTRNPDIFDAEGFDAEGFDAEGFDIDGWHRDSKRYWTGDRLAFYARAGFDPRGEACEY